MGSDLCKLRQVGLDFIDWKSSSKWEFIQSIELDTTAEAAFQIAQDDATYQYWFKELSNVKWSPGPRTVGTTRKLKFSNLSMGIIHMEEFFLLWETGKRFAFRFVTWNRPTFLAIKAGVEDYVFEALPDNRCRFTYTVHIEPGFMMWLLGFVVKKIMKSSFTNALILLRDYVKKLH